MTERTILLAGRAFSVAALPFGVLKRLLPAINRVAVALAIGRLDEPAMDDMGAVLCAATGIASADLDALPIQAHELGPAFETIVDLAGLKPAEGAPSGEPPAVAAPGIGTTSTPISPPASAGPGETSTL
jgi:hypothetical protein